MIKKVMICFFFVSMIFSAGCSTVKRIPLNEQNSRAIQTVYVDPAIKKPKEMHMFQSGSQVGAMFGAIGGVFAGAVNARVAEKMSLFTEKNKIDIRQIVYQQWLTQLNKQAKFELAQKPRDTVLITNISWYGMSIPHGFSTDYVPVLTINAKLLRNNQVIWQDQDSVYPLTSGLPRYKMDQIMQEPKNLYVMWDKASEKIISGMLASMNKPV